MKILFICQHYFPEPFKNNDICEALVQKGHEVDVITGTPNYPMGYTYEGYKKGEKSDEVINGVNIHRCKIIPRHNSNIFRLFNYLSYPHESTKYLKKTGKKYDVIFVYQLSPVTMAKAAVEYRKKFGTKVVLYCLDVWPESLKVGNVGEGTPLFEYYRRESKYIYKNCDKILITSRSFRDYFKREFNIEDDKIDYLPQYAESLFDYKKCTKKPDGKTDLLFAGNLGKAQSLETIINAANILKSEKQLFWHIVGDGSEYENIQKMTKNLKLDNVKFYGRRPIEEMPKFYSMADATLLTLEANSYISNTIPGKLQTYMAAGKPIIGAIDGESNKIIKESKCGFCGKAEDAEALAKNVKKFIKTKDKTEFSKNSYAYYKNNFRKEKFMKKLIEELTNMTSKQTSEVQSRKTAKSSRLAS